MKIAFVFPGQGSQAVGMMSGFAAHPVVRETFAEASDALGEDLWALVESGPQDQLALTTNTQPVMLTAGVAAWRAWQASGGPQPAVVAGHSLGEYTALVAAGALAFRDAVPLVRFRAQAMQDAVPAGQGAMAAIMGGDDGAVDVGLRRSRAGTGVRGRELQRAGPDRHRGSQGSGRARDRPREAEGREARRDAAGVGTVPQHAPASRCRSARRKARARSRVDSAAIPVIHNVDVEQHREPDEIREALARQAANPVHWTATILAMADMGVTHVVECGPGKVLAGLTKRIATRPAGVRADRQRGDRRDEGALQ